MFCFDRRFVVRVSQNRIDETNTSCEKAEKDKIDLPDFDYQLIGLFGANSRCDLHRTWLIRFRLPRGICIFWTCFYNNGAIFLGDGASKSSRSVDVVYARAFF